MIQETRQLTLSFKVVRLEDLRAFATIAFEEFQRCKQEDKYASFSIRVVCENDTVFTGSDLELFEATSPILNHRVTSIKIDTRSSSERYRIDMTFAHGSYSHTNYIQISGDNSLWVNGVLAKFHDVVNRITPQTRFFDRYFWLVWVLLSLGIGLLLFHPFIRFVALVTTPTTPSKLDLAINKSEFLQWVAKVIFSLVLGFYPAGFLAAKLRSLWPVVELQVGPEHAFIERKRRLWVANAMALAIVPLMVSFIYDALKLFHH